MKTAKTTWSAVPQATRRQEVALRLFDAGQQIPRRTNRPNALVSWCIPLIHHKGVPNTKDCVLDLPVAGYRLEAGDPQLFPEGFGVAIVNRLDGVDGLLEQLGD